MTEKEIDALLDIEIGNAQTVFQKYALEIGMKVAHPSEPVICKLAAIHDDGTVTIDWPPKGISCRVPLSECFDPSDCF